MVLGRKTTLEDKEELLPYSCIKLVLIHTICDACSGFYLIKQKKIGSHRMSGQRGSVWSCYMIVKWLRVKTLHCLIYSSTITMTRLCHMLNWT